MVSWAGWLEAPEAGMLARVLDVTGSQVRADSFLLRCALPLLPGRPRGVGGGRGAELVSAGSRDGPWVSEDGM